MEGQNRGRKVKTCRKEEGKTRLNEPEVPSLPSGFDGFLLESLDGSLVDHAGDAEQLSSER